MCLFGGGGGGRWGLRGYVCTGEGVCLYVSMAKYVTNKVLVTTIDAQWEGMGDVGSARYLADPTSPIPSHCAVITLFQSVTVHQLS